jgi:hypothetical protein
MGGHLDDLNRIECSKGVGVAPCLLQCRQQAIQLVRLLGTKADARSLMSTTLSLSRGTEASDIHRYVVHRKQRQSTGVRTLAEGDIQRHDHMVSHVLCTI